MEEIATHSYSEGLINRLIYKQTYRLKNVNKWRKRRKDERKSECVYV